MRKHIAVNLVLVLAMLGCAKEYQINTLHPDDLLGHWSAIEPIPDSPDTLQTSLTFEPQGRYTFAKTIITDQEADPEYSESGYWEVQYLDFDGDDRFDFTEDHELRFEVNTSTNQQNDGNVDFVEFTISESQGDATLTIVLTSDEILFLEKTE